MQIARSLLLAASALVAVAAGTAAGALTTLHSFNGADGMAPRAALVLASDGNFYGTTSLGGTGLNPAGTFFRITPGGTLTTIYTFSFQVTGDEPFGGVVEGSDGYFYGTTRGTGAYLGNVFRLSTSGTYTNLHAFGGFFGGGDGSHPEAGLVQGSDGYFYGTTLDGGAIGAGTVFRVNSNGDYSTRHSFGVPDVGFSPRVALVDGGDGLFYGTTSANVFSVTPGGTVTNVHAFVQAEGAGQASALVLGSDGNFYGTMSAGGANGVGTVYRVSSNGNLAVLHSFASNGIDGTNPQAGVVEAGDGNFYGTTSSGGTNYFGTVFRITPNGALATLHSFAANSIDGYSPSAGVVQGADGDLYGTTYYGGTNNKGTVFKLPTTVPTTTTTTAPVTTTSGTAVTSTMIGATTTNTASSTVAPTTTLPCASARCALDALPENPACTGQVIPSSVTGKLRQASTLIDQAASRPEKQARKLLKRAKKALKRAAANVKRAAKGRTPKLSRDCADALGSGVAGVVGRLGV